MRYWFDLSPTAYFLVNATLSAIFFALAFRYLGSGYVMMADCKDCATHPVPMKSAWPIEGFLFLWGFGLLGSATYALLTGKVPFPRR